MKTKIYLTFLFSILITFQLTAEPKWGATGHRAIGEIANSYLNSKTKRETKKLLQ